MNKLSKLLLECGVETGVVSSVGNNEVPVVGNIDGQESIECCSDEEMDKAINESKVYKLFESTVFPINTLLEAYGESKTKMTRLKEGLIELWKKITLFITQLVKRVRSFMMEKLGMYEKILKADNIDEGLSKISNNVIKGNVYYTDGEFKKYLKNTRIDTVYDELMKRTRLDKVEIIDKTNKFGMGAIEAENIDKSFYNTKGKMKKIFAEIFDDEIDSDDEISRLKLLEVFRGEVLESPKIEDLDFNSSYIKELIEGIKNITVKDEKELLNQVKKSSGKIANLKNKLGMESYSDMIIKDIAEGHETAIKLCTLLYQVRMDVVRETAFLAYKVGNAAIKAVA